MNEGINLLEPNKKKSTFILPGHLQRMRFLVVGLLFIVSVSSVILFILVALSPLPTLQSQEKSLEQNLLASKSDIVKLGLIKERTDSISMFLSKRQKLDQSLSLIESKLSGSATITALQVNNSGILLTAESSSLEDLDNFLNGLIQYVQQKKGFSQVLLVSLSTDPANGGYAVTVRLNPL